MGEMADLLMWDDPFDEIEDDDIVPRYKTCRSCGTTGLVWIGMIEGKWRLGDPFTKEEHKCPDSPFV